MPGGPFKGVSKGQAVLAVSMGGAAAFAAAIMLSAMDRERVFVARETVPATATTDGRAYAVSPFEEISTVGPHRVEVTVGGEHAVRAVGPAEAIDRLEVVVEGGTLIIRPRGSTWRRGRRELARITYFVTLPVLEAASLAGSGVLRVDRVEGTRFRGSLAGSGELAIAALAVEDADFSIAGSGDLLAAGTARAARVSIAGSGDLRARGLSSANATVRIMGSGDAALTVRQDARISILGSGDVDIAGPATCSVSRMGSGNVRCDGGS
jgi:hypothetical protein